MSTANRAPALILASTSRYRGELLARLGVPFVAAAPDCDEDAYTSSGSSPRLLDAREPA